MDELAALEVALACLIPISTLLADLNASGQLIPRLADLLPAVRIRAPLTTTTGGTIFAQELLNAALRKNPSLRFRTSDYSPPG